MARVLGDAGTFGRAYNLVGVELFTYPTLVRALAAAAGTKTACAEIPRARLRRGLLAAEELPFGEDGSTLVCDSARLERELGLTPTPSSAWMAELVRGAAVAPNLGDDATRAAELSLARAPIRLVPGARSRLRP